MVREFDLDIKKIRGYEEVTQRELGERIGVNKSRIYKIETSTQGVAFGQVVELYAALGYKLIARRIEEED